MKAEDIYDRVTANIIEALERGELGNWRAPWHGAAYLPTNASTRQSYRGGNVVALWAHGLLAEYPTQWWATYKQWAALGAQVRKGEQAVHLIKWVQAKERDDGGAREGETRLRQRRMFPSGFAVFNAAQVDGWEAPETESGVAPIEHCEAFFAAQGARIALGDPAYAPGLDRITLPPIGAFRDAAAYYATSAHEHAHWTGAKARLDRDLTGKFGGEAYAFEELVAELAASFLAAHLGIETEPRVDHAQYVASWVKVLRSDHAAIYKAASLAQRAADYLLERAGEREAQVAA